MAAVASSVPGLLDAAVGPMAVAVLAGAALHNWRRWRIDVESYEHPPRVTGSASVAAGGPRISVLVAAWNEAGLIDQHITSFLRLRYPDRQLVVCAGGGDGTLERARARAGERVVVLEQQPGEGKQRALARCLAASDGDILMLTDADCVFDDAAFERLIGPIVAGAALVTTGLAEPLPAQRAHPFVRYQWLSMLATLPGPTDRPWGVLGRNCALRREVAERLRAFDHPAPTGTDYVLSQLLHAGGYEIRQVPDSRIATRYPRTAVEYLRMWRRWIKNVLIHAPRHRARRELAAVLTAVALACFTLLGPLAYPAVGRAALIGPGLALAVASLNRARRIAVGSRRRPEGDLARRTAGSDWSLIARAPLMALLDQLAVVLAAYDSLAPGRRTRWR